MRRYLGWFSLLLAVGGLSGCMNITIFVGVDTATPPPAMTPTPMRPIAIATTQLPVATATPSPIPTRVVYEMPTPLPDYSPGRGLAVLVGEAPFALSIMRGGWQAYSIGPAENRWGYLVDITPLAPAVEGAYVEYKILPEYDGSQWVDVLWLRAPGIADSLPVSVDLIRTTEWQVAYQTETTLTPGDWAGFAMFPNAEGCGGVLDITPTDPERPARGAAIANTRVQPEFPGQWLQVARVQLSQGAVRQQAQLTYYTPGSRAEELLRMATTLMPGAGSAWTVTESQARQGYVVEVMPLKAIDNEVAAAAVRPEFDGIAWRDVLRIDVPPGRPPLEALVRVLAVPAP
jgi:hypothetical protein